MKIFVLALLLTIATGAPAMPGPNDYNVKVHVSGSHQVNSALEVNAIIDGKKYILASEHGYGGVLRPGDYNAKLVTDEHKNSYEFRQTYEFLFPDNKTQKYDLIGQSE
jgi:hypothetical protein